MSMVKAIDRCGAAAEDRRKRLCSGANLTVEEWLEEAVGSKEVSLFLQEFFGEQGAAKGRILIVRPLDGSYNKKGRRGWRLCVA